MNNTQLMLRVVKKAIGQQANNRKMKASTERKIIRWMHILVSIPIIGYIYGPVAQIPAAVAAIRWGILPFVVLSGFWLWKGHLVKRLFRKGRR